MTNTRFTFPLSTCAGCAGTIAAGFLYCDLCAAAGEQCAVCASPVGIAEPKVRDRVTLAVC